MTQNDEMNNKKLSMILKVVVVTIVVAVIGLVLTSFVLRPPETAPPPIPQPDRVLMDIFLKVKTMVSLVNVVFIITLMSIYSGIYRQVKSQFTMGLIIVMLVLLLYALTSNPLVQILFGYQAQGIGPFAMIPDVFATFALGLLLYISME